MRKLRLTGCRLVTRNVKVISTHLEHWFKSVIIAIFYRINKTLLVSFFVHRRKSWDRFRIWLETLKVSISETNYTYQTPRLRHYQDRFLPRICILPYLHSLLRILTTRCQITRNDWSHWSVNNTLPDDKKYLVSLKCKQQSSFHLYSTILYFIK